MHMRYKLPEVEVAWTHIIAISQVYVVGLRRLDSLTSHYTHTRHTQAKLNDQVGVGRPCRHVKAAEEARALAFRSRTGGRGRLAVADGRGEDDDDVDDEGRRDCYEAGGCTDGI